MTKMEKIRGAAKLATDADLELTDLLRVMVKRGESQKNDSKRLRSARNKLLRAIEEIDSVLQGETRAISITEGQANDVLGMLSDVPWNIAEQGFFKRSKELEIQIRRAFNIKSPLLAIVDRDHEAEGFET